MKHLHKSFCLSLLMALCLTLFTGCGPSEEKIAEAQTKYAELVEVHNQAVEAHKEIASDSLDADLVTLSKKLDQIENFHLNEMKDEEIDTLIQSMDTIMASYQEYLSAIGQIKAQEEAAVLVTIPVTLQNETDITFQELTLHEKGDSASDSNVLEDGSDLVSGQYITGLFIYRDVTNTPWILELQDAEGNSYELELPVENYSEEGCSLTLTYDSETENLKCA